MEPVTIVAFGDSITCPNMATGHYMDRRSLMWTHQLKLGLKAREIFAEVINSGVSGDRVPAAYERLEGDCLAFEPDYVTIMFGLNDAWITPKEEIVIRPERFAAYLKKMIRAVRGAGAEPVLMSPNPMTERYPYYNERRLLQERGVNYAVKKHVAAMAGVARERRVDYIDFFHGFQKEPDWKERLVPDGLHPGKEGNRLMARVLSDFFSEKIKGCAAKRKSRSR